MMRFSKKCADVGKPANRAEEKSEIKIKKSETKQEYGFFTLLLLFHFTNFRIFHLVVFVQV